MCIWTSSVCLSFCSKWCWPQRAPTVSLPCPARRHSSDTGCYSRPIRNGACAFLCKCRLMPSSNQSRGQPHRQAPHQNGKEHAKHSALAPFITQVSDMGCCIAVEPHMLLARFKSKLIYYCRQAAQQHSTYRGSAGHAKIRGATTDCKTSEMPSIRKNAMQLLVLQEPPRP